MSLQNRSEHKQGAGRRIMRNPVIWALTDNIPGHEAHTHGFVRALSLVCEPQVHWISAEMRAGFARNLLRGLVNSDPIVPLGVLRACYRLSDLPQSKPNIILSSGGKTSFINAALAKRFHAANFFYGTLRELKAEHFTAFATPFQAEDVPNNLVLPAPLVNIDPHVLANKGKALRAELGMGDQKLYCALIGGDGSGYVYSKADWYALAHAMEKMAVRDNAKWLITTSRRTGNEADKILQDSLPAGLVADAVWYSSAPRKVVAAYLGAAQGALVTEDSMTMVGEAVAAGLPVLTIAPTGARPDKGAVIVLQPLAEGGAITRASPQDDLQMGAPPPPRYSAENQEKDLAHALSRLLGWSNLG